jgi:hypothetical protein
MKLENRKEVHSSKLALSRGFPLMTGFCSMEIYAYYKFTQEIQTEV